MRTNIEIDKPLIDEAMLQAGTQTMRETVDLALRELVARRRQRSVLDLVGEGLIDPEYDLLEVRKQPAHGPD